MSDQSNRQAPLGEVQRGVLRALREKGGWPGHGWTWGSPSLTRRVLNSLVRRGLVEVSTLESRWGDPYEFYSAVRDAEAGRLPARG